MQTEWRALEETDLDAVMALAALAHPTFPERRAVFAEKRALFPQGALKLAAREAAEAPDGELLGYAFAHPWAQGRVPKLDAFLGALPWPADCLYLHDCVVAPSARGANASGRLVAHLRALAQTEGFAQLALIAVYGSEAAWMRHGFHPVAWPQAEAALASYGNGARILLARV
jgi:GNAT superfamily N-acetyltransferase